MRTETITRTIYTFDELPEDAKRKAIEKLSDINVDYDLWDCTCEDARRVGIEITSFDLNRSRNCKTDISDCEETANLILKNHGKNCETFKTAKAFLDEINPLITKHEKADDILNRHEYTISQASYNRIDRIIEDLHGGIEDLRDDFKKSISEDYAIILQKEYEYLTSEDAIVETIKSNEYEFDEQGNLA